MWPAVKQRSNKQSQISNLSSNKLDPTEHFNHRQTLRSKRTHSINTSLFNFPTASSTLFYTTFPVETASSDIDVILFCCTKISPLDSTKQLG
jgi:hypothetical protein